MRRPRARFTLRWLLVAVAALGLGIGLWTEARRRAAAEAAARADRPLMAAWHAYWQRRLSDQIADSGRLAVANSPAVARTRARVAYHAAMRAKWERAAARPQEPVVPDPPPPD